MALSERDPVILQHMIAYSSGRAETTAPARSAIVSPNTPL